MAQHSFDVVGIVPADLPHAGLALAASRSGGIGVLDLEFTSDDALAARNFDRLLAGASGRVGLRIVAAKAGLARRLVQGAGERSLLLILAGPSAQLKDLRREAGARALDVCLGEILSAADLSAAEDACDGTVARGHESGGWVGEDTSFILLQKLRGRTAKPLFVQGGIGVRAAAACRAAGAAGVVLDDALLLLEESPLPATQQAELARLDGSEVRSLGEAHGRPCRVFARPASPALKAAEEDARNVEGGSLAADEFERRLGARIGWTATADGAPLLPVGQGIGLAGRYREIHRSVGRLVQAVRRQSLRQCTSAAELGFLDEGGPLAKSHGTRFPLVQGPMTRVSDSPAFAAEVARGGALPILALALMRGPQVETMLRETRDRCDTQPWGVGLLGFIPQALRDEQCAEIWKCKPAFALIAGGRPDQAAEFEKRGIATYIHAPAPALLRLYLEQGARRFVFEGRECGGHVGPLASFPLWEQMIETLLAHVPKGEEKDVHVLFAGGIHDAASGAMVAALAAPLAEAGMKVGALMGTAYLFTQEIVSSGAVVEGFQREALRCERTTNLESGVGHATRCVDTQFARDFTETRRRLVREGRTGEEIREILEDLNLGRLRIASKGIERDAEGRIAEVPAERQLRDGMYMIGQVATMRREVLAVEALHRDVAHGSHALLREQAEARVDRVAKARPSDIAIVGIGVTLPKADSAEDYWQLIVDKTSIVREVPGDRWDPALLFDANQKARDKIYSKWGGFLDDVPFDPLRYGIPPKSMKSIDPLQLLTLETAARTLADAGYSDGRFDRENTSVILGAGGGAGDLGVQYSMRAELPRFVENPTPETWERLPEWTEESFAGTLLNVAAGRVANRLDFGGVNFTVDAACGSSLAAIAIAVHELETGRSAMVLAGGFDTTQSAFAFTAFAKTQALSPQGKPRTFDQAADGIVISEGVAMVALKRLADAEADGDRIYAVIKAASGSSDGKALGLTAPRTEGQVRALERAYPKAGFSPATLGLIEAHGTGTPVGDRTEAQTINRALTQAEALPRSVAIGSVKTILGHTKAAAGAAGLIKMALALHHRVLPGHLGVDKPIDAIADPSAPVYLLQDARPWIAHPDHPRRAGVSAFGFGGTNFHAVLEEYRGGAAPNGSRRWPAELFLFRAADAVAMARDLRRVLAAVQPDSTVNAGELAFALARQAELQRGRPLALAIVAASLGALAADLTAALAFVEGNAKALPPGIRFSAATPAESPSLAFLFPGQGAQYVNMGREAALYFDEVREALELADATLRAEHPSPLSMRILPPSAFSDEERAVQASALTDTRVAQPAIGALSLGYLRLAERLGLSPAATAGHSYGEYSALMAARALTPADFLRLSSARGRAMAAAAGASAPGAMAAVQATRERIVALIEGCEGVCVANHNAPEQSVISGPKASVERAVQRLADEGIRAVMLQVSGAFHTELVAPAKAPLSEAIRAAGFSAPHVPVYSNTTAAPYPSDPSGMRELLDGHMLGSVEFVAEIEAMHAAGCRVFLELGPKGICTAMARQTLAGRDAVTASLDANGGGLRGLLLGLADLFVAGVAFDAAALFAGRELALLDLARLESLAARSPIPKHWWMVSGGCARPVDDPVRRTGVREPLTKASSDAARAAFMAAIEAQVRAGMPAQAPAAPAPAVAPPVSAPVAGIAMPRSGAVPGEALVAYQETMRQFLALQERVMQQFLAGGSAAPEAPRIDGFAAPVASAIPVPIAAPAPASAPAVVAPASVAAMPSIPSPQPEPVAEAAVDVRAVLLVLVAERTGYPPEMLALDADLEADLGIDSIKRTEILGALRKALPAAMAADMQARMETFTRSRSLAQIVASFGTTTITAAVAAPVAVATQAVDVNAMLLGIVAERTGYPPEMLSPTADLEADLGIDSIKRTEILGALRKALPAAMAADMQARMETFTRARSLAQIVAALGAVPVQIAASPQPAVATQAVDVNAVLLGIVAERTGYPPDMLAPDADLEADLGIDSIKRTEILGALRKALPAAMAADMQARMETFTRSRSLAQIVAALAAAPASAGAPAPEPETKPEFARPRVDIVADVAPEAPLSRFVIKSRSAPLPQQDAALQGLALVLGPESAIVDGVMAQMHECGLTPLHLAQTDAGALRTAIADARGRHGPIAALLHLHGLGSPDAEDLAAWRGLYHRDLLSLFHALQAAIEDLPSARVIAASRLGGTFGRDAVGGGGPVAGGVNGILNCVRNEYPACRARAVDFDGQSDADIVRLVATELLTDDAEPEAGYIGLERFAAATVREPLTASPFPAQVLPDGDWVLLATGGARGITAEIIEELVRPGMRLVLLGRTAEPAPEDASLARHPDAASLRRALLAARIEKGERPRPVEIDRDVSRVLVDREVRANLARLRAAGAEVEYVACDVRDEAAFGGLIDDLYGRLGRIDAVIHGAGVIEDKLLADKTAESFERVLGTKLDAAFVLSRKLRPESLKLLSFFTSVAGRYGNRGQSDYAAANEALNRLAWDLHRRWTQTRVVAVNWGPWDAGMANESVRAALRERGMTPIPVKAGRRFFVDELARGPRNEVELVAGDGPWARFAAPSAAEAIVTPPAAPGYPLVRRAPRIGLGGAVTLEHRLCLADDPYLADHVLDGTAVLPLAVAMEYMAQFVASGWPGWQVAELRDVRALAGVAIDEHGSDVVLRAKAATHSEAGGQSVTVEMADPRRKAGPNFRATAILLRQLPDSASPLIARIPDQHQPTLEIQGAYPLHLSQGERLQSLADVLMTPAGGDAHVRCSTPRGFLGDRGAGDWLFDPALMDALSQMAFLWAQLHRRKGAISTRMGSVRRFGAGPVTGMLRLAQRFRTIDLEDTLTYVAEFVDATGLVRFAIGDGEGAMSTSLNRLAPGASDSAGRGR